MKIKIDSKNLSTISAALAAVNGSAVDHTYDTSDIVRLAAEAEVLAIELFDNKKTTVGARYGAESGGAVPSAYKYNRISTVVTLEKCVSGWFLVGVSRGSVWKKGGSQRLYLTPAQDILATAKARSRYTVRPIV